MPGWWTKNIISILLFANPCYPSSPPASSLLFSFPLLHTSAPQQSLSMRMSEFTVIEEDCISYRMRDVKERKEGRRGESREEREREGEGEER